MPIASLESVMGRQSLLPFLAAECVDVCIVDPLWNGVDESCKMAALCDAFEVNCAAHNYHGWLGTAICAHFGAAIPNFKVGFPLFEHTKIHPFRHVKIIYLYVSNGPISNSTCLYH